MGANLFFPLPSLLVKADDELTGSFIWHLANEHWTKWVDFALAVFLIISASLQVSDVIFEVVEGDPRNVLCEAVEKHHASVLVVGSHGYGAIKRYLILSFLTSPPPPPPNHLMYLILFSNLVHWCSQIHWTPVRYPVNTVERLLGSSTTATSQFTHGCIMSKSLSYLQKVRAHRFSHFSCRAVLGSVSDYCVHNARCTVMIVKRPKMPWLLLSWQYYWKTCNIFLSSKKHGWNLQSFPDPSNSHAA